MHIHQLGMLKGRGIEHCENKLMILFAYWGPPDTGHPNRNRDAISVWTGSIQRDPRLHWGNIEANLRCPNLPHGNYNWWIAAEEAAENGYNGRRYTYINRIHFKCTNMVRWQQRISCYLIRPCRMKSTFTCFTYQVRRHVQWSIEQVGWHWPMSHCFDFLFIWEFFKRNFVAVVS